MNFQEQIKDYAINQFDESMAGIYGCDLHNELFNSDYYCVGYYESNKFLEDYGGVFKAIHRIKNYEKEMFGEIYTDFSDCEKVANMLAYIEGESFLMEASEHLGKCWNDKLTEEDIEIIKSELENY